MKKIMVTLIMVMTITCCISGCGMKDYSFTQEAWDENDLSFVNDLSDPNEANRFIGFFAKNYEGYRAILVQPTESIPYEYIGVGIRTTQGAVGYDYIILDNKAAARECYDLLTTTDDKFDVEVVEMDYGDKAVKVCYKFGDESKNYEIHFILEGKCVLRVFPVKGDPEEEPITAALMEYMY